MAVPLILAAGLAVDYSMANAEKTNMQYIADGAALAGGKIFDGTNLSDAQAAAQIFISSYSDKLPKDTAFDISADGRTLKVDLEGSVDTAFMGIANINSVKVGVNAAAISPAKPSKVTFTPTKAQGFWYKIVSIMVVRPGTTDEVVLGTVTYQPTTQNDQGQGTMTVVPAKGIIDLGNYDKLILKMDIKEDGCPLKKHATVNKKKDVTCNDSTASADKKYNTTLRTDNPDTTDYLFVDGKQMPKGMAFPLEAYFGCNKPQSHAWEDGGGWDRQDFFYTVSSDCSGADGNFVRLTQ